jgi:TRAP-type C4-dicarboxylate transport system permease large subunit
MIRPRPPEIKHCRVARSLVAQVGATALASWRVTQVIALICVVPGMPLRGIVYGAPPFVGVILGFLAFICAFPGAAPWLPRQMK